MRNLFLGPLGLERLWRQEGNSARMRDDASGQRAGVGTWGPQREMGEAASLEGQRLGSPQVSVGQCGAVDRARWHGWTSRVPVLALPPTSCVTSGQAPRSLGLSELLIWSTYIS